MIFSTGCVRVEMYALIVLFGSFILATSEVVQFTSVVKDRAPVADIVLIIDQSGSIGAKYYEEEIDFAQQFVASFPISPDRTRIALIEFSLPNMTRVRLNWKNGVSPEVVRSTLDGMRHAQLGTGTDFGRAWTVALEQLQNADAGDRPDAPNVAVMVTDGYLNSRFERYPAFAAAHKLRNSGTLMYAIHVKLDPGMHKAPIEDLTEMTGNRSRVFAVDDFRRLTDELLKHITQQITEEYQDCVYVYEPSGLCYSNSINYTCVQDANLQIIRSPQSPHGHPCPTDNVTLAACDPGACQDACEKWAWGVWGECTSETCGVNGTKTRRRDGNPPYEKLTTTCQLTESKHCSKEEIEAMVCPEGGVAEQVQAGPGGSHMPVWAIVLIVLLCICIVSLVIAGFIVHRSPRWRMVFVPRRHRKNQLPGNDDVSTASL